MNYFMMLIYPLVGGISSHNCHHVNMWIRSAKPIVVCRGDRFARVYQIKVIPDPATSHKVKCIVVT
jgi:hypothetical protein